MEEAFSFLSKYTMLDIIGILYFTVMIMIISVRAAEGGIKKVKSVAKSIYNKMRGKEIKEEAIDDSIKQVDILTNEVNAIKKQQKDNVELFTEHELGVLDKLEELSGKVSELSQVLKDVNKQCELLETNLEDNKKRNDEVDRDLLRDRILGGMRFFNQNRDERGKVHISRSDHENMTHLFDRYFERNGNGTVEQKYKNEFLKFIIDD